MPLSSRQDAFERLVYQYQDRVYGYACYILGDRELAADVTQTVLIRLWKHRRGLDEERLLGWLLRVTRNACVDALRRRQTYRRFVDSDADAVERTATDRPLPDAAAEASDIPGHLQRALAALREPYRSIVVLREIQELKYEEIADALDLPLGTVKVYLHRGRKMLREQLQPVLDRETA